MYNGMEDGGYTTQSGWMYKREEHDMLRGLFCLVCGMATGFVLEKLGVKLWSLKGFGIVIIIAVIFVLAMYLVTK